MTHFPRSEVILGPLPTIRRLGSNNAGAARLRAQFAIGFALVFSSPNCAGAEAGAGMQREMVSEMSSY